MTQVNEPKPNDWVILVNADISDLKAAGRCDLYRIATNGALSSSRQNLESAQIAWEIARQQDAFHTVWIGNHDQPTGPWQRW